MRIGVLTTSYPRHDGDAAGAFVAGFSGWLAAHVGDVDVICADGDRPLFAGGGAPAGLERGRWGEALTFSARLAWAAARRGRDWDALVSHWLVPCGAIAAVLAASAAGGGRRMRRRHLAIAHGSDVRLLRRLPGGERLIRGIARRAELVYVADALRVAGAPGRVVPMGLEVAPIVAATGAGARQAARHALGIADDRVVVAFLGRLIPGKGCDLLIDALPLIDAPPRTIDGRPAPSTLLVAGDGPERAALEERARQRAPADIRFLGHVAGPAKLALLAAADLLAIPSRVDGAPIVALEALAAGLPIVATRIGGLPELLDARTTRFADAAAPSLAAALSELAGDAAQRARMAAAARALGPAHDWSKVAPALWGDAGSALGGCIQISRV